MIRTLIIKKTFHKYRLLGKWFVIAVDGTGVLSFKKRHCEQCLTKTSKKGKVSYFHHVLEAKLICTNGFAVSIASEWFENPEGDFEKQNCEIKAFKRLAENLKKMFPRLPVCITADGLYPNQTFFCICKNNNWSFIVTFKDGNLPSVWEEVYSLKGITTDNKSNRTIVQKGKKIHYAYCWINEIPYQGFCINWIECIETVENPKNNETESTKFVHVTDQKIIKSIAEKISQTGRLRWKIENEGFNVQKNHGYNLKHKYSKISLSAAKNYYQCLQITHLLNQLIILNSQFQKLLNDKRTIKHLWKCLIVFLIFGAVSEKELSTNFQVKNSNSF
jgi:hypothetical protein